MNSRHLGSPLAGRIERFIELRQLCGRDYQSQALLLAYFDRFLVQQKTKRTRITRDIIETYQRSLSHLSPRVQENRMCVVRQLCEYLARHDLQTFIPEPTKPTPAYTVRKPYIYSDSELHRLLNAALKLPPAASLRPQTYYTLLGLLYSTGIRIGEACDLNLESFDGHLQALFIANGKFRKARWIALSDSTCKALQSYVDRRLEKIPNSPVDPLFLNERQRRLCHTTVYHTYRRLLDHCGIGYNKQSGPRIHDLRHTFAVNRLLAWYRDGLDINVRLPFLATYMGHVDIQYTQVYLQPTAELLTQVSDRFHGHYVRTMRTKGGK